jgi:DUF4097 and DUF4098 domain-containing protein YvlB
MGKIKVWLIAGGSFMLAAAIIFVIGMTSIGWDFYALDTAEYSDKEYILSAEDTAALTSVAVTVDSGKIDIFALDSTHTTVGVYYNENESNPDTTVKFENGKLTVRQKYKFNIKDLSIVHNWNFTQRKISLYLPDNVDLIEIKANSGSANIDGITAGKFTFDISSGKVYLASVNAVSAEFDIDSGSVTLNTVTADSLSFDINSGKAYLKNVTATNISAEIDSGKIDLKNVSVYNLSAEINSGKITGEIAGNKADYTIMVSVKSGSSNIKSQQSAVGKHIFIDIDSGSARIDFV